MEPYAMMCVINAVSFFVLHNPTYNIVYSVLPDYPNLKSSWKRVQHKLGWSYESVFYIGLVLTK